MNLFSYIRRAYHPIFHLRRLVAFRRLQDMIDFDVWIKSPLQRGGDVREDVARPKPDTSP